MMAAYLLAQLIHPELCDSNGPGTVSAPVNRSTLGWEKSFILPLIDLLKLEASRNLRRNPVHRGCPSSHARQTNADNILVLRNSVTHWQPRAQIPSPLDV